MFIIILSCYNHYSL